MVQDEIVYQGNIIRDISGAFYGQVVIDRSTGLITEVLKVGKDSLHKNSRIFGKNSYIFAGMGDIHIHAREDGSGKHLHKEDYGTSGNAALNGGLVHVSAMPNTPNPVTTQTLFNWHRNRVQKLNHRVSILNYVGIGKGTRPIGKPGQHPYKAFFGKSVGDLTFYDESELEEALSHYVGHNISFHVEYEPIVERHRSGKTHSERRPVEAVNKGLELLLPLIEKYNIKAKLCHWSTGGESFEMIEKHRDRQERNGQHRTTIEVSPLHLLFDSDMAERDPSLWLKIQMNPAVQTLQHRLDLIHGLRTGFIDYLATDHAPHTLEEKHRAFEKFKSEFPELSNEEIALKLKEEKPDLFRETCCEDGTSGAPWLDTYANVCAHLIRSENFSPFEIARVTASNPGEFVNQFLPHQFNGQDFGKGFGKIEPGYVGSLTVINTKNQETVRNENLQTKVGWSPLDGMVFPGGLEAVVIRGEEVTGNFIS